MSGEASPADRRNQEFWDELCGTTFARELGITDASRESLERFDAAYFDFYPYLLEHVRPERMKGQRVLEVGLGYGTLGQRIAEAGADYLGLDVAAGPVEMMRRRLEQHSLPGGAVQGSFLTNELESDAFDHVVAIGCFHHTGDFPKCVAETYRILKPGGRCVIMVYNRFSLRQWLRWPARTLLDFAGKPSAASEAQRGAYDVDAAGTAAPVTEFCSIRELEALFAEFSRVRCRRENFDDVRIGGVRLLPRRALLWALGPLFGLDVYGEAEKPDSERLSTP